MIPSYQLRVKQPVACLAAVLRHYVQDCFLALEGDLSRLDVSLIPGTSEEPNDLLTRQTTNPVLDFAILPVNEATRVVVCKQVLPQVGLRQHVVHIQIAAEGRLVFGAYDNWHDDCVWVEQATGRETVVAFLDAGIIGRF